MNRSKSNTGLSPRTTGNSGLTRTTSGIASGKRTIDKEVYLDAQSKGLTSRVVKYYQDNNAGSSRQSMYKSPGDLPIVHLKSNNIMLKHRRSNSLTNLRVGRLDKNYANFDNRREILQRGLSTYDESYRPSPQPRDVPVLPRMVHPMDPFISPRSVLDELKEISRKRINKCDEHVELKETKKYCRDVAEIDGPSSGSAAASHQMVNQKRQRDHISPPGMGQGFSPPQRTKKICKDSYDVISSLSSSIGLARSKSSFPTATAATSTSGIKRPGSDLRSTRTGLDKMPFMGNSILPPIPQPSRPASQNIPKLIPSASSSSAQDTLRATASVPVMRLIPKPPVQEQPKLTLFNKDYSTIPALKRTASDNSDDEEEDSGYRNPFVKPQESTSPTLVAGREEKRKVEQTKLALMLKSLAGDFGNSSSEDEEEEKKVAKDTVDTTKIPPIALPTIAAPSTTTIPITKPIVSAPPPTSTSVVAPIAKPISVAAASPIKFNLDPQPLIAQPAAEENVVPKSVAPPTSAVSSSSIVASPPATTTVAEKSGFNSPTAAMFTFDKTTTSPATSTAAAAPLVIESQGTSPGFKFGAAIPPLAGITPISSSAAAVTKTTIPGIFSFPKSPKTVNSTPAVTTTTTISGITAQPAAAGMFSFGGTTSSLPVVASSKPTEIKLPSAAPTSTFSFGGGTNAGGAVNSSILNNSTAASAAPPVFGFGNTPMKDPTPALLPVSSTAAPQSTGGFNFGGGNSTVGKTAPSSQSTTAASSGMFSFGNTNTTAASQPATGVPSFGGFGGAASGGTSTTSAGPFGGNNSGSMNAPVVFGANKSAFGNVGNPTTKPPAFGSTAATTTTNLGSSATFSFGGTTNSSSTTVSSPFGGGNSTGISPSPIFGAPTNSQPNPPSYGAEQKHSGVSGFGGLGTSGPVFGAQNGTTSGGGGTGSPFNFGGNNQSTTTTGIGSSPSPFGGGSSSSTIKPIEPHKSSPFAFGGGGGGAGGGNHNPTPAFSFGGVGSGAVGGGGGNSTFGGANMTQNNLSGGGGGSSIFGAAATTGSSINSSIRPIVPQFGGGGGGGGSSVTGSSTPFGDTNKVNSTFNFGQSTTTATVMPNQRPAGGAFNFSGGGGGGGGPANVTVGGIGGGNSSGAFKFGDSTGKPSIQSNTNNPSGGGGGMFNFGGGQQQSAAQGAPSNAFNFGQQNSGGGGGATGNPFGGVAPGGGGMFNFGAQGDPNAAGGGGPTFNIGSGGGGPPRRPIRQATRRLK